MPPSSDAVAICEELAALRETQEPFWDYLIAPRCQLVEIPESAPATLVDPPSPAPDLHPFVAFPKIARYSRGVVVTEKIDGTNAQIYIGDDGTMLAGSRTRWITPMNDNYGFAAWVRDHEDELRMLGPGRHFGEWWGQGIQRNYGLKEKRFSLFNVERWRDGRAPRPACCGVVPILWESPLDKLDIPAVMDCLREHGSYAAEGFMKPEGIVIYHKHGNVAFKKTFEKDEAGKGQE